MQRDWTILRVLRALRGENSIDVSATGEIEPVQLRALGASVIEIFANSAISAFEPLAPHRHAPAFDSGAAQRRDDAVSDVVADLHQ
jgi:hypothetical protein